MRFILSAQGMFGRFHGLGQWKRVHRLVKEMD